MPSSLPYKQVVWKTVPWLLRGIPFAQSVGERQHPAQLKLPLKVGMGGIEIYHTYAIHNQGDPLLWWFTYIGGAGIGSAAG